MALRPSSLQKNYDDFYSGDPAFVQAPEDDGTDATKELIKAHAERIRIARETSNWQPLLVEGGNPTKFTMRPLPGSVFRAIVDRLESKATGPAAGQALLVRAALRGVTNLEDNQVEKVELVNVFGIDGVASVAIVDKLDACDPGIIRELGDEVYRRCTASPRR